MQSGTAKTHRWLLEFVPESQRAIDPLMGWTSSSETLTQLKLWFDSREDAEAYARTHGLAFVVDEPKEAQRRTVSYSDNFKYTRIGQWTH